MSIKMLRKYASLRREAKDLTNRARALAKEADAMESEVQDYMIEEGVDQMRVEEGLLYVQRQLWAGVDRQFDETSPMAHKRASEALEAAGLGEFCGAKVTTQALSSYFREIAQEQEMPNLDEILPDSLKGAIKLTEKIKVAVRGS